MQAALPAGVHEFKFVFNKFIFIFIFIDLMQVALPAGVHEFKFVVNDHWVTTSDVGSPPLTN